MFVVLCCGGIAERAGETSVGDDGLMWELGVLWFWGGFFIIPDRSAITLLFQRSTTHARLRQG